MNECENHDIFLSSYQMLGRPHDEFEARFRVTRQKRIHVALVDSASSHPFTLPLRPKRVDHLERTLLEVFLFLTIITAITSDGNWKPRS